MADDKKETTGSVMISNEVINIIASLAINDVEGIYSSDKRKAKKNLGKCIEIENEDGRIAIRLKLYIGYDTKLPVMVDSVQGKIKSSVENMTGFEVSSVDIDIIGMTREEE